MQSLIGTTSTHRKEEKWSSSLLEHSAFLPSYIFKDHCCLYISAIHPLFLPPPIMQSLIGNTSTHLQWAIARRNAHRHCCCKAKLSSMSKSWGWESWEIRVANASHLQTFRREAWGKNNLIWKNKEATKSNFELQKDPNGKGVSWSEKESGFVAQHRR